MEITRQSYNFRRPLSPRKRTNHLIYHHVGPMPAGKVYGGIVHRWHRNRQTASGMYWNGLGYNALILEDGTVEEGRPFDTQGAHTPGFNSSSFGVLVVGDFDKAPPSDIQVEKSIEFGRWLAEERYPGIKTIGGHGEFTSTACPGRYFPMQEIKKKIREEDEEKVTEETLTWQQELSMDMLERLADLGYLEDPDMHIEAVRDMKEGRKVRDFVLITVLARVAEELEKLK